MSPTPEERARIRTAMDRILGGTAERSIRALTVVALVQEAGVPRNALTQRHTDLKAEFYDRVAQRGGTPEVETRLRDTIANQQLWEALANGTVPRSRDRPLTRKKLGQKCLES